jgi:photosystem II stability/assembly factor-like uncharacterized protein
MKGDISRDTFGPTNHLSSVRLQQGRIVTDADWNEQADLTRYRAECQAEDIIGDCGAPIHAAGFGLTAATYPLAVCALSGSPGGVLVVGEDGVVLRTLDDGVNWQIINVGTTAHLRALQFAGSTGWAVGDSGAIWKTIDGGQSWQAQNSGVTIALRGLCALDAMRIWAVGDSGIILSTNDGGTTWNSVKAGSSRLTAVHFLSALVGVAVGHRGEILRTSNGGATWNKIEITTADLHTLAFVGGVGWAAGEDGKILKTTDQGQNWTVLNTSPKRTLRAIAFGDTNTGWAVGDDGCALHTTNGGSNWNQQNLGTSATLRGVSFSSAQSGWIIGDDSVAIRFGIGSPGFVPTKLPGVSFSIEPGRFYAHGTLCELDRRAAYYNQPDRGRLSRLAAGLYLVYLDVWQRHLSCLEAPGIREVALGGVDTATRAKTICQVKTLELPRGSPSTSSTWNCLSEIAGWTSLVASPKARLRARSEPQQTTTGVCEIAAAAGYRRVENQLYRVEVHDGSGGHETFKWSRENGSVAFVVESVTVTGSETVLRLAARGRDENLDIAAGDWVEILDDDAVLEQRAGLLANYVSDGNDLNEIKLAGALSGTVGRNASDPLLRRWEQKPSGTAGALPIKEGEWIGLEDGVQIWFESGGSYRPGDYWLIPARTITGDVEWPRDDDGEPQAQPPAGVGDRYCRLGIIEVHSDGSIEIVSDCRNLFPPLTELRQLFYVSGDGQEVCPDPTALAAFLPLPKPLRVGVAKGQWPVADAPVRFQISSGNGRLKPATGTPANLVVKQTNLEVIVKTAPDGIAGCDWELDSATLSQQVKATLLDAASQPVHLPVLFTANLSVASQVAYDPRNCATLSAAGVKTVQQAIDELCGDAGSCACTVCVSPDAHNSGKLSLQTAIDKVVKAGGGTICLEVGKYVLKAPLKIQNARSIRIIGKGVLSQLNSQLMAIAVSDKSADVRLEAFSIVCGGSKGGSAVLLHSSSGISLERLEISNKNIEGSAVGLSGALDSVMIRDNDLSATAGIVNITGDVATGLADLRIEGNRFACGRVAVSLSGVSAHQQVSRLVANQVVGCTDVGFEFSGSTVPGFGMEVASNVFHVLGDGIRAGVDGLRVVDNDLIPFKPSSDNKQHGVVLTKGTSDRLEDIQIVGNRIIDFAFGITTDEKAKAMQLGSVVITRNQIAKANLGLRVVGRIESLNIENNQINGAIGVDSPGGRVVACGNQVEIIVGGPGLTITCREGDCVFSNNQSHHVKPQGKRDVALIARTLAVASNRIVGKAQMSLETAINDKKEPLCTVLGNLTGGDILVNGVPLALPWAPLNFQGVV